MSMDEFLRVGEAVRMLAFHLGQRFGSNGHAHLNTAQDRLLEAAKAGTVSIVAGPKSWSGSGAFPLPAECVHGLTTSNVDWDNSLFDATADAPVEATASIQQLHSGPSTLWVPLSEFAGAFGIDNDTVGRWNRR